jgi:2-keto-4-pentenoate hydratase/2-oxohepta-3-ene-1,7-dioic acid hydratase in catechol pathway
MLALAAYLKGSKAMRIARIGNPGQEKPAVLQGDHYILVDSLISDWSRQSLEDGALAKVAAADLSALPRVAKGSTRIGSPINRPTKVICVGLNYLGHIKETNADTPAEPVIFMKAPDSVVGPNDDIVIPPNSLATDYEVELAIVIGKRALYLESPEQSKNHILGYTISQDVSERHWQIERSGQWVKGKSFPTFNPIGPEIVTGDEINPHNLRLWCSVNDVMKQDSNTDDLLFGIDHIVWYISQFMELFPGDVINTGTPFGVGLGFKPPVYLAAGDLVKTGIEGIGEITSHCIAYKG